MSARAWRHRGVWSVGIWRAEATQRRLKSELQRRWRREVRRARKAAQR